MLFNRIFNRGNKEDSLQLAISYLLSLQKIFLELINPRVQSYAEQFSSEEDELLKEINAFTQNHKESQMLSGHLQGKLLEMVSRMVQARENFGDWYFYGV